MGAKNGKRFLRFSGRLRLVRTGGWARRGERRIDCLSEFKGEGKDSTGLRLERGIEGTIVIGLSILRSSFPLEPHGLTEGLPTPKNRMDARQRDPDHKFETGHHIYFLNNQEGKEHIVDDTDMPFFEVCFLPFVKRTIWKKDSTKMKNSSSSRFSFPFLIVFFFLIYFFSRFFLLWKFI